MQKLQQKPTNEYLVTPNIVIILFRVLKYIVSFARTPNNVVQRLSEQKKKINVKFPRAPVRSVDERKLITSNKIYDDFP